MKGCTGTFLTPADERELDAHPIPATAKCDSCRKNPAKHWFGYTSVRICDEAECLRVQEERFAEHSRQIEVEQEPQW